MMEAHDEGSAHPRERIVQSEKETFLGLRNFPAILYPQEVAWILGESRGAVTKLVAAGLLKPLGSVGAKDWQRFSREHVLSRLRDQKWKDRAIDTIHATTKDIPDASA